MNCVTLREQGLGNSKSSELMDRMLNLLSEHKPDLLFVQLFLRQLPFQVRAILATADTSDCRALAGEADKYFLAGQQHCAAAMIPPQPGSPPPGDTAVTIAMTTCIRQQDTGLCSYRARFGAKARKCISPCKFSLPANTRASAR